MDVEPADGASSQLPAVPEIREDILRLLMLLGVCGVGAILFEAFRARELTWDGLWNARTGLWAALLLLANLLAVWWYAHLTRRHVALAHKQWKLSAAARFEANKPVCVVDRRRYPEREKMPGAENFAYVVRNIGPGIAVNVRLVAIVERTMVIHRLGALGGNSELNLYEQIALPFRDAHYPTHDAYKRVIVVADGIKRRTAQWSATINARLPTGEIAHRMVTLTPSRGGEPLRACLEREWPRFERLMAQLEADESF